MPAAYASPGAPTVVQTRVGRVADNTAGLPAVGRPEDEARAERKGNGGKAALITLFVILLLAGIGWLAAMWFGNQQPPVVTTTVPRLVGLTAQQAESALAQKKLKGSATEEASTAEKGTVFKQDPAQGQTVNEGSTISYVVSTGPDTVKVPDVTGMSEEAAKQALQDAGLTVSGTKDVNDPSQDKGKVVSTDPAVGQSVNSGSAVTLNLASGKVEIPTDLVGQQWTIVSTRLANDYHVTPVPTYVDSADKTPGEVLSVEHAGEAVKVGSKIKVEVAQSPIPTQTVTQTETITAPPSTPTSTPSSTTTKPGDGGGGGGNG
jgi:serine/threonine-protein kinase